MSDEAAFLEALKANPADDTTRLVYADWLQDRDETAKAEYLRAAVDLTHALREPATDVTSLLGRIDALSGAIAVDWRLATAARFALVLESFDLTRKINAIKLVREMTGMGLAEAKDFVERAPSAFLYRTTPEGADGLQRYFGAGQVRISPDISKVADKTPTAATFAVHANLEPLNFDWNEEPILPEEAFAAFRKFLVEVGAPQAEINGISRHMTLVTIGEELSYSRSQSEMHRWRALLPPDNSERAWAIILHFNPRLPSIR